MSGDRANNKSWYLQKESPLRPIIVTSLIGGQTRVIADRSEAIPDVGDCHPAERGTDAPRNDKAAPPVAQELPAIPKLYSKYDRACSWTVGLTSLGTLSTISARADFTLACKSGFNLRTCWKVFNNRLAV